MQDRGLGSECDVGCEGPRGDAEEEEDGGGEEEEEIAPLEPAAATTLTTPKVSKALLQRGSSARSSRVRPCSGLRFALGAT